MKKIKLDGVELIAGLDWTALPGELPERKAMAEFMANNKGAKRGIVLRSNGVVVVGHGLEDGKDGKKAEKLPSAAALLALANQKLLADAGGLSSEATSEEHNWIVVQPIDGQENILWMGAAKNGVPIPGMDMVADRDKIIEEITEMLVSSSNFTVFTQDKNVRYNVISQVNVIEKSFAELTAAISPAKAVPKLFSIAAILAVGLLVAVLILAGAWFGYSQYAAKKKMRDAAISAAAQQEAQTQQLAADKVTYQKSVQDALLAALKQGTDEVAAAVAAPSPYENVVAWRDLVYSVDLYQSGWDITGLDCALEDVNIPACKVNLARGEMGVNRILLGDHPDALIEGDKASYVVRGPQLGARPARFSSVSSSLSFTNGIVSDLQSLRGASIQHTVEASTEIVKQTPLPPPPPSLAALAAAAASADPNAPPAADPNAPVTIQLGVANGGLTIAGQGLWQLSGVARYLDVSNVRAKSVTISVNAAGPQSAPWILTLEYFVKTAPQPVLPNVPFGEETITVQLPEEFRAPPQALAATGAVTASTVNAAAPVAGSGEQAPAQGTEVTPPPPPPPPPAQ